MISPTSLDQYNTTPTDDPTQFADPLEQQKMAENVLTQLGLHPNQQGAKSLLDAHFSGPTGSPEVKEAIAAPLVDTSSVPATEPPKETSTPPAASSPPPVAKTEGGISNVPTIPSPQNPNSQLITNNASDRIAKAQNEVGRLIDTGSGIHQIKNPFLRGLAHVGEIAGDIFTPNLVKDIPGTEQHHNMLIRQQQGLIGNEEKTKKEESDINRVDATTQNEEDTVKELNEWIKQNPGRPIKEYWEQKAEAGNLKLTPAQSAMRYLTLSASDGGLGLPPDVALQRVQGILNTSKPANAAQQKQDFENLISKMNPGQPLDPKFMTDMPTLVKAIGSSPNLSEDERQKAFSYLVTNNTPASSAYAPNSRAETMKGMRLFNGIDQDNHPIFVTPEMVAEDPTHHKYTPGTLGEHALSKNAAFADIDFNMGNVEEALKGLKDGFSNSARAQMALALRSSDPHSAFASFMNSEIANSLTPDQIDYVTALASLSENALALRSIQGLGQGSDELRAAITRMIPGPGTPNEDFANRQMELLKGTVDRARQGILVPNTKLPSAPPAKTTSELHDKNNPPASPTEGKTVSRTAIEKEVKQMNENNKDNPGWKKLTIEDALKEAKDKGIVVK